MNNTMTALLLKMQRNEITEHRIYTTLARAIRDPANRRVLGRIAVDEMRHYAKLKAVTGIELKPRRLKVWFYYAVSRVFGLSFGLKLMEKGETLAARAYGVLAEKTAALRSVSLDEQKHEKALLAILSEERLEYAGSIILGLNDALVELTGALAGLTLALQDTKLIRLAGLVTGFAASLSMAASNYLSSKEEASSAGTAKASAGTAKASAGTAKASAGTAKAAATAEKKAGAKANRGGFKKTPFKAALYTGVAYIVTVLLLVLPYFLLENAFASLALTLGSALAIVFLYTFYITTAKGLRFRRRFLEMAVISFVIAAISFFAGLLLKRLVG